MRGSSGRRGKADTAGEGRAQGVAHRSSVSKAPRA